MKNKKNPSILENLRAIRDKISLETMNMNFEELQHYFDERKKNFEGKNKKSRHTPSIAADHEIKYGRK